jgi:hypothetical protein
MLPATYQIPATLVLLLSGVLACFFGHRLFRVVLALFGFIIGALAASSVVGSSSSTYMLVAAIAGGLAHFAGLPQISIDGDRAVVVSYLQILTPQPTAEPVAVPGHGTSRGYRVYRVGANRWELERTAQGWKIRRRTLRPLDGSEPARELLRTALKAYEPAR